MKKMLFAAAAVAVIASPAAAAAMEAAEPPEDPKRAFRFCRLFPDLPKFQPDDAGLIALGQGVGV